MIRPYSKLVVADNTGAKEILVIGLKKASLKKGAGVGDIVSASCKQSTPRSQVKKGDKVLALIIRTRKNIKREDGSYISFSDNAAILVNPDRSPRGTRIFGPISKELRDRGFSKIVSMAGEVL